jgi:hypothetical protein
VLLDTAMTRVTALSSFPVASTAVRIHAAHARSTLLTCSDYLFYGNNIAAGQFEEQVWAPVCSDPAISEVSAREDVKFDWTART